MIREQNGITDQHACYSLTFTIVDWVDLFVTPEYKQVIVRSLNDYIDNKGLIVYGWCLMSHRLHLMAQAKDGQGLSFLLREWKKRTAQELLAIIGLEPELRRNWILERFEQNCEMLKRLEKYQVWQDSSNARYIDLSNAMIGEDHLRIIHEHPVKDQVVDLPSHYTYSSARDYEGFNGLVKIKRLPLTQERWKPLQQLEADRLLAQSLRN